MRANWLEPVLAALLLFLSLTFGPDLNPAALTLTVLVCISAGMSAMLPRLAALSGNIFLISFWLLPPDDVNLMGVALCINVFTLVRRRSPQRRLLITLSLLSSFSVMVAHAFSDAQDALPAAAVLTVLFAISVGGGLVWRSGVLQIARVKEEASEQVAALRMSLARDLHDTVAQTLSNAAMRAHMAGMDPDVSDELRGALEDIATDCGNAAQDLRKLLSTLRDLDETVTTQTGPLADSDSLERTVVEQVERLRRGGFFVRSDVQLSAPISPARADAVSKVTVEAVNNMVKHALPGGECRIVIRADRNSLRAEYWNQTQGRRRSAKGLGIIGIHERMHLLDGTCSAEEKDGWWQTEIFVPLHNEPPTTISDGPPRAADRRQPSEAPGSTFGDNRQARFAKSTSDALQ